MKFKNVLVYTSEQALPKVFTDLCHRVFEINRMQECLDADLKAELRLVTIPYLLRPE